MYVKPLIRVNSCLMVPPWALAVSLALNLSVGESMSGHTRFEVLVNLFGRSSLLQGNLSKIHR